MTLAAIRHHVVDMLGLLTDVRGRAISLPQLSNVLTSLDGQRKEVTGVEVASELMQPGSHSGILRLSLAGGAAPRSVFLKRITATHVPMADRPWPDRRRTLAYARTEARFYQEFAADGAMEARLMRLGVRLPRLAMSENSMDTLLGDAAVHEAAGEEPSAELQAGAGAMLFMECGEGYTQASPLSETQAKVALRAVAGLHAAGWEDEPMLRRASERLQRHGGVYALEIRSPAELTKLQPNWDAFCGAFGDLEPELFERPGVAGLGERLARWTAYASERVSPGPADRYATLVHGDFKAMNVLLPLDGGSTAAGGAAAGGLVAGGAAPMLIVSMASVVCASGISDCSSYAAPARRQVGVC